LSKFYNLSCCVIQVKLNIQKLRDTQRTVAQSVGQLSNDLTEDQLKATPSAVSGFQQVRLLNSRHGIYSHFILCLSNDVRGSA